MEYKASKRGSELTVKVKLSKVDKNSDDKPRKFWPWMALKLVENDYNVEGYLKNPVIMSSYDEEVEAEYVFKLKEEKKSRGRKTKSSKPKSTRDGKSDLSGEEDKEES